MSKVARGKKTQPPYYKIVILCTFLKKREEGTLLYYYEEKDALVTDRRAIDVRSIRFVYFVMCTAVVLREHRLGEKLYSLFNNKFCKAKLNKKGLIGRRFMVYIYKCNHII